MAGPNNSLAVFMILNLFEAIFVGCCELQNNKFYYWSLCYYGTQKQREIAGISSLSQSPLLCAIMLAIALGPPNLAPAPWPLSVLWEYFWFIQVTNHARIVQRVKGQALADGWWGLEWSNIIQSAHLSLCQVFIGFLFVGVPYSITFHHLN